MGVCSYCYTWQRDECFGWSEARGCTGITGPDDPKYLANKAAYNVRKAAELRQQADTLEADTATRVGNLRREAEHLEAGAAEITRQIRSPTPSS